MKIMSLISAMAGAALGSLASPSMSAMDMLERINRPKKWQQVLSFDRRDGKISHYVIDHRALERNKYAP